MEPLTFAENLDKTYAANPLLFKVVIVLASAAIAHFLAKYVLYRLEKLTKLTTGYWDDVVIHATLKPLPALIWVLGFTLAGTILHAKYDYEIFNYFPLIRNVGVVLCVAWFFWRLIDGISEAYLTSGTRATDAVDQTTTGALNKLGHLVVFIAAVLAIMQVLGFSISGLLAAGGVGGIAIGFAAKDLLANFFGGLTVYLDRPFNVGDWIRSPDKDIEGVVEMISWRHTRIRRFNKNPIYVPNSYFTTIAVENPSRMSNRRIKEMIGIRYDDIAAMADIVKDVKAMLREHKDIDTSKTLIVNFTAFNASSVDFMIYTFTKTLDWVEYHEVKQDVFLKVADIVAKHNAEMAFPTQTLHIANEQGGQS